MNITTIVFQSPLSAAESEFFHRASHKKKARFLGREYSVTSVSINYHDEAIAQLRLAINNLDLKFNNPQLYRASVEDCRKRYDNSKWLEIQLCS